MKKFIVYLFSGAWYFEVLFRNFVVVTISPLVRLILLILLNVFPFAKRNLKKRGITIEQHIDNNFKLCSQYTRIDLGGFSQRSMERYLTYVLFLFFAEAVCILKRLVDIDILNNIVHNYTLAVLIICTLLASFCVTKIENFVMKGKRLTSLDRKPKDFRHKALFVFLASCFVVIFVFFKLWLWPGIVHHLK